MAVTEIRLKMNLSLYALLKFDCNIKKQEKFFEFVSDSDVLQVKKGDVLIGVHPKDGSRATDVRNFDQEKLDDLLSNAMRGKYLSLRIIRRAHEDSEKFLNADSLKVSIYQYLKYSSK